VSRRSNWRHTLLALVILGAGSWVLLTLASSEPSAAIEPLAHGVSARSTATAIAAELQSGLPGGASPRSALVMVQGMVDRRLVIWPLHGRSPAQEIDIHVRTWPLLPDPAGMRLLYATDNTVMVFDTVSGKATIIGELPTEDCLFESAQWSPDGRAIAYVVYTNQRGLAYYARADGSTLAVPFQSVPRGMSLEVAWLADSHPAAVSLGVGALGGLEAHVEIYDPTLNVNFLLPPDTVAFQTYAPQRSPDGKQQVFSIYHWDETRYQGACRTGPLGRTNDRWLFLTWQRFSKGFDIAFEVEGLFMDWPTWLDDGRVLFRGMATEACPEVETGLYIGTPDETPVRLVRTGPSASADDSDKLLWSMSYALSPDQTYVTWTQNDEAARQSTVQLTALATGQTTTLFATTPEPDADPFHYVDNQMILHFTWLP
jgi:hypothetical protein